MDISDISGSGTQKIQSMMQKKALRFLVNVFTSGKYDTSEKYEGKKAIGASDALMRYVFMNFIILFGCSILSVFACVGFMIGRYVSAVSCVCMALACIAAFAIARTGARQIVPALMLVVFYGLLCAMVTYKGEADGANFLFMYMYPPLATMLLGMQGGMMSSFVLLAVISLEMFVPGLSYFKYNFDFSIRMLASYVLVSSVVFAIDITRKAKDWMIDNQNKKLNELNEKLLALSTTDELTGLNNRRAFIAHIEMIWKQSQRLALPLTVMMIDIDFFKRYNDALGHLEGDKALVAIARCMKNHLKRETDFVARYGGEEFVCLFPYVDKTEAASFANRLVQSVEKMKLPHPDSSHSPYLTISAGMASAVPGNSNKWSDLLGEADKALYKAKAAGRNGLAVSG